MTTSPPCCILKTTDASGRLISKTAPDGVYTYVWSGDLLSQINYDYTDNSNNTVHTFARFTYDSDGAPTSLYCCDGSTYALYHYVLGYGGDVELLLAEVCPVEASGGL